MAYKLLIDIPREYKRKGIFLADLDIERIAYLLKIETITPEQIEKVIPIIVENRETSKQEIRNRLNIRDISDNELETIVKEKIKQVGKENLQTPKDESRYIPKIVAQVLEACNYSVRGKTILKLVNSFLKEVV